MKMKKEKHFSFEVQLAGLLGGNAVLSSVHVLSS